MQGIRETTITSMAVSLKEQGVIFVGTNKGIYRFHQESFNNPLVFQAHGPQKRINHLYISAENPNIVYAATDSGLYMSEDHGDRWKYWVHSHKNEFKKATSVLVDKSVIYLGTIRGLLYKNMDSPIWTKAKGVLYGNGVSFMAQDDRYLYVAMGTELFRMQKQGQQTSEIFTLSSGGGSGRNSPLEQESSENFKDAIRFLYIVKKQKKTYFYMVTTDGIFRTVNQGKVWQRLTSAGLPVKGLNAMMALPILSDSSKENECCRILVGTDQGVFQYSQERWIPLYQGMEAREVGFLTFDEKTIYAGTDQGVFALDRINFFNRDAKEDPDAKQEGLWNYQNIQHQFVHEPSIQVVQKLAIDYAEVHPNKIRKWRAAARRKALLPSLSIGFDRAGSDLFHWDTGASPDVLQKGRDYIDWDVSLSWDFSDLIWSSDQTSIDSRSKLMVELREDILDQVTRIYFERRRIQIELRLSEWEPQVILDKQMRVHELTALIDALTAGAFSRLITHQIPIRERSSK